MYLQFPVDTCSRKYIVGSLRVGGWREHEENKGHFCHVYKHYQAPIPIYDAPPTPIVEKKPVELKSACFLETFEGSGVYTFPCENVDLEYFQSSRDKRDKNPRDLSIFVAPSFVKNMSLSFELKNTAMENIDVLLLVASVKDDIYSIVDSEDGIVLAPLSQLIIPKLIQLDFEKLSGQDIDVISTLRTRGRASNAVTEVSDTNSFRVP